MSQAHDDMLWTPMAEAVPEKWRYSRRDRDGEPPWRYTLRTHMALYGSWRKLQEHRHGLCPYLLELGTLDVCRMPHALELARPDASAGRSICSASA